METTYMPRVIEATWIKDYIVHVVFSNGREGNVNLESLLGQGVFKPLLDKDYFRKLFSDGWTVSWPNGADIAPETLYDMVCLSSHMVNEAGPGPDGGLAP